MYSKKEIIQIAKAQLAIDYNFNLLDFDKEINIIVEN